MASTAMAGTIWFWNEAGAAAATSFVWRYLNPLIFRVFLLIP